MSIYQSPFSLVVSNGADSLVLTDDLREILVEYSGFDPPKSTLLSTLLYNVDGAIYQSSKSDKRAITLSIYIFRNVESWRNRIYDIFRTGNAVTLTYTKGTVDRTIKGYVETIETPQFNAPERARQIITIGIVCFSPFWESPEVEVSDSFSKEASSATYGIQIGTLSNSGDVPCGLRYEVTCESGSMTDLGVAVYTNRLNLLNSSLSAGETLIVDTKDKVIYKTDGTTETNMIGCWDHGNEWLTLSDGESKAIYVRFKTSAGCTGNASASIKPLYQGV